MMKKNLISIGSEVKDTANTIFVAYISTWRKW